MTKLVTIGIPIYKRLGYLPNILQIVRSQDYPQIELIVSDNGMNGSEIPEIVDKYYPGSYKFRQNATTVSISQHFNQLVHEASGDYFVLLADDDEISPSYISELVFLLDHNSSAATAIASEEMMDEYGTTIRKSRTDLPDMVSGMDFIRSAWHTHEYKFECFATFMARTEMIKALGGYPDFTTGTHNDDALLIKLCLTGDVVFSNRCCFRWRVYESSHGWSLSITDLAKASREFLQFLDSDPTLLKFARHNPERWAITRNYLVALGWKTYYWRWTGLYRRRLSTSEWLKAAFAMPFIPSYYRMVIRTLRRAGRSAVVSESKGRFPQAYKMYHAVKHSRFFRPN